MPEDHHVRAKNNSYRNLQAARECAQRERNYNSLSTRSEITRLFEAKFGSPPHSWQLDVAEAMILGLDSLVIAGTGSGKTIPFILPLMLDTTKKGLVISPLKVLQEDQSGRFGRLGVIAAPVNEDTWSGGLQQDLKDNRIRAVFTSPEMCLGHDQFRNTLASSFQNIFALVVDEAHCISQWGDDFREEYGQLGKLRSLFPPSIPILATTATLTPDAVNDVQQKLGIDPHGSFFLNLGNDRPNISYAVHCVKTPDDFDSLKRFLTHTPGLPQTPNDLRKTIVFVNTRAASQICARNIRDWLPDHLKDQVDYIHALRSPFTRRRVMEMFRKGDRRLTVATEVAGMGADIPDIEQVIQLGVPSSLSVWIQRAGRAGTLV